MLGGNLLVHHYSLLLPYKVQSVCVCVDQHAVWIKSRQKVGAFFFSGLDVAPRHTASAAAVCDIVGGKSCRKSEFRHHHFPMETSKTAFHDELSFCSIGCMVVVVVCGWGGVAG